MNQARHIGLDVQQNTVFCWSSILAAWSDHDLITRGINPSCREILSPFRILIPNGLLKIRFVAAS